MRHVILYRRDAVSQRQDEAELQAAAEAGFHVIGHRTQVQPGDLVVGRYSVVPFYEDLEFDLQSLGARLVNDTRQHRFASDISYWYPVLKDFTPQTWFDLQDVEDVPVVLKGVVNSRKHTWDQDMYAPNRRRASDVYMRLSQDGLVGAQTICIRRYVPLVTYGQAVGGLPVTCEWRFFVLDGTVVGSGYYWHSFAEDLPIPPDVLESEPKEARLLVDHVAKLVHEGRKSRFYTIDVAKTQAGHWIVIELNDAQMAGLEGISPRTFYEATITKLRRNR